ncbi:MAG: hypothetical protein JSW06_06810 [Thermoplasmatales archaeon]|nr:MAG: hypothetical protein JSW06_06810 [Thermoplasmatales archaeon]
MLGGIDLTKKIHVISIIIVASIFFAMYVNCFTINAQDVLEITGPVDAFEGEEIEFTVTLDGEPIQAKVIFGNSLFVNWTNSSTGIIRFTMPPAPIEDKEYVVKAEVLGGLNANHSILVKNRTGILKIELSTDYIIEMEKFNVTVKDRDEHVIRANVWFNSAKYVTDSEGNVTLIAPDILITTNYGISVNKTGYKSNSTMITINEVDLGLKLMEVIHPSIVEPGVANIEVNVIGKYGSLENVTIEIYYENSKYSEYKTDRKGRVSIQAPSINNDNYFSLYVSKDGYSMYNVEKEITVSLFSRDLGSDLEISLTPSEVYEGDLVKAEVTDDIGLSVEGVTIWKGYLELDVTTDSMGRAEFIAPSVFMDREYHIYAIKKGYNYAESKITLRDRISNLEKLTIEIETVINESEVFYVTIKDESNIPLEEVSTIFNSEEILTNENGTASFTAPNVTIDTFYSVECSKYGYLPSSTSIEVINLDGDVSSRKIQICIAPYVMESNEFTVTIRDDQGNLLSGARVTFMDISLVTDFKGTVTFTAPDINWDRIQEILVTKFAYESTSAEITIRNNEEFQYWYLVLVILIILIIGFIAFFKYGRIV